MYFRRYNVRMDSTTEFSKTHEELVQLWKDNICHLVGTESRIYPGDWMFACWLCNKWNNGEWQYKADPVKGFP